jgi:hypothetical protein
MENFLEENEISGLNESLKTVKNDVFLSTGVYLMKLKEIVPGTDKNTNKYLKFVFLTGFLTKEKEERTINKLFYTSGEYKDGTKKVDELARFLKRSFKIKEVSNENLKMAIGRELAIATLKNVGGYIDFWYAGHKEELKEMKAAYKRKDQSNGEAPEPKAENEKAENVNTNAPQDDDLPDFLR